MGVIAPQGIAGIVINTTNNYSYTFIYVIFTLDHHPVYICNIHITKSVKLIKPSILRGFTGVMLQN
jgi:hypothetical protein